MNTFTIADAFSHGWEKTKKHFWLVVGVLATQWAISMIFSYVGKATEDAVLINIILFIISMVVGILLRIGSLSFFFNAEKDKGQFKDLFDAQGVFFNYFVAYVLLSIVIILGFILLIVPGIILYLVYMFVPMLIVDKKMAVLDSFKKSAEMTKGHRLHLLGFVCVAVLINFVGAIAFLIGLFVTMPITIFASLYIYHRLSHTHEHHPHHTEHHHHHSEHTA